METMSGVGGAGGVGVFPTLDASCCSYNGTKLLKLKVSIFWW